MQMLTRGECEPSDVVAFLENRYRSLFDYRIIRSKPEVRETADSCRVLPFYSSGVRYKDEGKLFFNAFEHELLAYQEYAIWSDWTPMGVILSCAEVLEFLRGESPPSKDGKWAPRIGMHNGELSLWTVKKRNALPVSKCLVTYSDLGIGFDGSTDEIGIGSIDIVSFDPGDVENNRETSPTSVERALRDSVNARLGYEGELLVLNRERRRLCSIGMPDAAKDVCHVSQKPGGDRYGYDIHSFDEKGNDRFIEVKTTRGDMRTPFYLSRNEKKVSERECARWELIRVYNYGEHPKGFVLTPPLASVLELEPTNFVASFRAGRSGLDAGEIQSRTWS